MATRAKFGYLNYADMLTLLNSDDPKKKLNAHDIVFGKDTKEQYWISPELEPVAIRSRVLCFDTTTDAYKALNADSATYEGQIVAVKNGTNYEGYIVNVNTKGKYYVTPMSVSGEIDYNTIGNRPIENVIGTLDTPVTLDQLSTGVYRVSGQYKISQNIETTYLTTTANLYMVNKTDSSVTIRKIDTEEIITYTITGGEVSKVRVLTEEMLANYATIAYVDAKLAALDIVTKDDVKAYVDELLATTIDELVETKVEAKFNESLDERIDARIDEKITEVEDNSISELFV